MLIRQEKLHDHQLIHRVHSVAFRRAEHPAEVPPEATLVDELRSSGAWLPALSLVAVENVGVVGHVVCSRAWVEEHPVLGLGPIGVHSDYQREGIGQALMHAVLGTADALEEPLVGVLGSPDYYERFGFEPASNYSITPPVAEWKSAFRIRGLTAHEPGVHGTFRYAEPFHQL